MGGWTVDPESANAAAAGLAPAADLAGDSASTLLSAVVAQGTGKWGAETGPGTFRSAYVDALWTVRDDLRVMQQRLDSYVEGVRQAVVAFQASDSDAAARTALDEAQLQQQQLEQAPPAPPTNPAGRPGPLMY